jgi:hypothetical protein
MYNSLGLGWIKMFLSLSTIFVGLTLTDWGSWWAIVSGAIALGLLIFTIVKWSITRFHIHHRITVQFLIPMNHYPRRNFHGAPARESTSSELTIGIGIYRLLYQIRTKEDIEYDPPILIFEGNQKNRPDNLGNDNLFIVDTSNSGIRDWWGNLLPIATPHSTKYLHHEDVGMCGVRIETRGTWNGRICIEIRMKNKPIISKYLQLSVSDNPKDDEIPFLKMTKTESNWQPL